ncbi:MAG: SpoIIE family protein phosphatase [Deltaproteobacteria bacterium]|nr:SpoIIE family protein phosphatase [Deltaproteobacteria bacterium]
MVKSGNMTFNIRHYPVFERGTFLDNPDLFSRFAQNLADRQQGGYKRAWQTMAGYEEAIHWPLLAGPGLYGATHPGADNVFVETMSGMNSFIYNSDCLYANPSKRVFAISDPPGITASARRLFEALDRLLPESDTLKDAVNRLNGQTPPDEAATLSLVHVPEDRPDKALVLLAGDSLLFHGNERSRRLITLAGNPAFIGTPSARFEPEEITLSAGDFFILASDGILSIRGNHIEKRLEDALMEHVDGSMENFVHSAMSACNRHIEDRIFDRPFTRFGGHDNVSLLLVQPEKLPKDCSFPGIILGGERQNL